MSIYEVPDHNLEPIESTEYVDDYTSELNFPLDIEVTVEEGHYPNIENVEDFESQAETYLYDKETGFDYGMDVNDVLDDVLDLLEDYITPDEPGKYRMTGRFKLVYNLSGLIIDDEDEDNRYHSDEVSVEFKQKASSIKDLEFVKVTASTNIISSIVKYSNLPEATDSSKYGMNLTATYEGVEYSIHYTEVDSSPEADEDELFNSFKAQISEIHPYDAANYVSAIIQNGNIYYRSNGNGNQLRKKYYKPSEIDMDNDEWIENLCSEVIKNLREMNRDIEPRIIHN